MMLSFLKPSVSSSGVAASKQSRKDVSEAAKLKKSLRAQCAESVRCYYGYLRLDDEVFVTERGKREENQVVKTDGRATGAGATKRRSAPYLTRPSMISGSRTHSTRGSASRTQAE